MCTHYRCISELNVDPVLFPLLENISEAFREQFKKQEQNWEISGHHRRKNNITDSGSGSSLRSAQNGKITQYLWLELKLFEPAILNGDVVYAGQHWPVRYLFEFGLPSNQEKFRQAIPEIFPNYLWEKQIQQINHPIDSVAIRSGLWSA